MLTLHEQSERFAIELSLLELEHAQLKRIARSAARGSSLRNTSLSVIFAVGLMVALHMRDIWQT